MSEKIYYLKDPVTNEVRYVGQTKLTLEKRLEHHWCHRYLEKYKNNYKNNWLKKLWKDHKIKPTIHLIEKGNWSNEKLNEKELFYIKDYFKKGYKLTNTSLNPQFRHSTSRINKFGKKLYCYDIKGNLKTFVNTRDAYRQLKIDYKKISNDIKKERFTFNYCFSLEPLSLNEITKRFKNTKIILSIKGINIKTKKELVFITQQEAATFLKVNFRNISQALKGLRKSCGGYKWEYITKEEYKNLKTKN